MNRTVVIADSSLLIALDNIREIDVLTRFHLHALRSFIDISFAKETDNGG
jgi:hypothetical protein